MGEQKFWAMEREEAIEARDIAMVVLDAHPIAQEIKHRFGVTNIRGLGGYAVALQVGSHQEADMLLQHFPDDMAVSVQIRDFSRPIIAYGAVS